MKSLGEVRSVIWGIVVEGELAAACYFHDALKVESKTEWLSVAAGAGQFSVTGQELVVEITTCIATDQLVLLAFVMRVELNCFRLL